MSKAKAIPLDEMNKQIANDCRNNAQKLREEADYLEKCADIIDANKNYDQYELLKEFVEYVQNEYNQIEQYVIKQIEELPRRQIKDRDTLQVVEEKVIDEDKKTNLLKELDVMRPILIEIRKGLPNYLERFIKEREK